MAGPTRTPVSPGAAESRADRLRRLAALPAGDSLHVLLRARVIEDWLPLANRLAARYAGRGEPLDDLRQVAAVALILSVDRFDPGLGVPFAGYATPAITGALKRHFRDSVCRIRIPRGSQELWARLTSAGERLAQREQRTLDLGELAAALGVDVERARTACREASVQWVGSLDQLMDDRRVPLREMLGAADPDIEGIATRDALRTCLAELTARERRIVILRFVAELPQHRIAADVGLSQMQVSRLLSRIMLRLRERLST
ncbi:MULTISPECIES: sigma-70 family RNA polymerase sigma factor [Catenuloplanes]|uniref:RNA polymerase sigma-B factor n=1 Tax=Catenuloplanes niger TaxID=587534 RepID=A0AAE4CVQ3_9ACTN|nr:sigma-70 family RNA polymerase sigma factor [Catenuloplanes niger]MDR7327641.1 RNA polymerase sigma-B factor [Catenuloplanes niger]